MLYALIGSGLLGALSTAFLLWRKSVVEKDLTKALAAVESGRAVYEALARELMLRSQDFDARMAHLSAELETVKGQRDQVIATLAKVSPPGTIADLIRMRAMPKDPGNP